MRVGWAATASAGLLLASCGSGASCERAPAGSCADLTLHGWLYDEWRPVTPPRIRQEVGNATYPACNAACDEFEGFGATDVWHVPGVGRARAVLGLREGTHTYVVFVRQGTDPESLRPLIDPRLLAGAVDQP